MSQSIVPLSTQLLVVGNGNSYSIAADEGEILQKRYKYYDLQRITSSEMFVNEPRQREPTMKNMERRNKREFDDLLEHTVEPLRKKRKTWNLFSSVTISMTFTDSIKNYKDYLKCIKKTGIRIQFKNKNNSRNGIVIALQRTKKLKDYGIETIMLLMLIKKGNE
jgi:isopropylmalate/homocitrate/citramalate synthase